MMTADGAPARPGTFLVLGVTGGTGTHFLRLALAEGHPVRALVRDPARLTVADPLLTVHQGSLPEVPGLDALLAGVDAVAVMVGDAAAQRRGPVTAPFVQALVPAMRRHGVRRLLYQAGALSTPPEGSLPPRLWLIRNTMGGTYQGQHRDNEAVMRYLADEAHDIDWVVHRAGIGSDGPSRGVLARSEDQYSIATFRDCAAYNYRALHDPGASHTCDFSHYRSVR